jgi:hypothetical protein
MHRSRAASKHVFSLIQGVIDRMKAKNAAFFPAEADWGTTDRSVIGQVSP